MIWETSVKEDAFKTKNGDQDKEDWVEDALQEHFVMTNILLRRSQCEIDQQYFIDFLSVHLEFVQLLKYDVSDSSHPKKMFSVFMKEQENSVNPDYLSSSIQLINCIILCTRLSRVFYSIATSSQIIKELLSEEMKLEGGLVSSSQDQMSMHLKGVTKRWRSFNNF